MSIGTVVNAHDDFMTTQQSIANAKCCILQIFFTSEKKITHSRRVDPSALIITQKNYLDRSLALNEAAADKIRKYRADYNNNPPSSVAFMPTIPSTSGRLHSEFV